MVTDRKPLLGGDPGLQAARDKLVGRGLAPPDYFRIDFLEDMDGRFRPAQRLRARYRQLITALGGMELLSPQIDSLVRRVVHLEALIEESEQARLENKPPLLDIGAYLQSVNVLVGLYKAIGLKHHAKPIATLQDVLRKEAGS